MLPLCLHDKTEIERFLRRNTFLHLYAIGDLDNFFWQFTTWYGFKEAEEIQELALVYVGTDLPVLLAIGEEPVGGLAGLLRSCLHLLPRRLYAHLSDGLAGVFERDYTVQSQGLHFKMALSDPGRLNQVDITGVTPLSMNELQEIQAFYASSYPRNWFDPRMLETGQYFGIRRSGVLASVAGIHVYSPAYRVGVLGNITTHPAYRGQGLATAASARLCLSLLETVDHVGLNVKAANESAIACYRKLGFEIVGTYEEFMLEEKR